MTKTSLQKMQRTVMMVGAARDAVWSENGHHSVQQEMLFVVRMVMLEAGGGTGKHS